LISTIPNVDHLIGLENKNRINNKKNKKNTMFFKFTTQSKTNPSIVIIPSDKILKISQNPPLECEYEDFCLENFDEENGGKRYFTRGYNASEIIIQNLDENGNVTGNEWEWETVKRHSQKYDEIIKWVKDKKYPEWKAKMTDKHSPFTVQIIDGQEVKILEDLKEIQDILEGPEPF
jgi:hypothetical protein